MPQPPRPGFGKRRTRRRGVRATARPADTQPTRPAARRPPGLVSQIFAAAALSVFGSMMLLLASLHEYAYHTAAGELATALWGGAGCVGVALGLVLPRVLLAPPASHVVHGRSDSPVAFDFAATLTGFLILGLGLSWLLTLLVTLGLESYRGWLVTRFGLPPYLMMALVHAPALLALSWTALVAALAFVALHGWQRLLIVARRSMLEMWLVVALALVGGALAVAIAGESRVLTLPALLAVFGGGVLAVWRKRTQAVFERSQAPAAPLTLIGFETLVLTIVAAAMLALELTQALGPIVRDAGALGLRTALLILTVVGAVFMAVALRRRLADVDMLVVAAGAVGWSLPWHVLVGARAAALFELGWLSVCAIVYLVGAARRATAACGNVQYVLSWFGALVAGGLVVGLTAGGLGAACATEHTVDVLATLAVAATVAVLLLLSARPSPRVRATGLTLVAVSALLLLVAPQPGAAAQRDDASAWQDEVRARLVAPAGLLVTTAASGPGAPIGDIDLRQRDVPTVLICDNAEPPLAAAPDDAGRLVRRLLHTLCTGGRVIAESPADVRTLASLLPVAQRAQAWQLTVESPHGTYVALLCGRDAAAWAQRRGWPREYAVRVAALPP